MKKFKRKFLVPVIVTGMSVGFIVAANATSSDPGSQSDPIVTLSFVEQRLEQLKYYVNDKVQSTFEYSIKNKGEIDALKEENSQLQAQIAELENNIGSGNSNLEVIQLEKGQMLICDGGTEVILRAGKAKAIAAELGGLSDVTAGVDIQMGEEITTNHLLVIPRSDGRGVYASEHCYLMVRGKYEIK